MPEREDRAVTVGIDAPGQPASHQVRPLAALGLVAGHGVGRVVQYAGVSALLLAWGTDEYAVYAAAVGTFGWLVALVAVGPEKAALKVLPRARRTEADLRRAFIALEALSLPAGAVFLLAALLSGWSQNVLVYVGTAAAEMGIGANVVLVALCRLRGWLARDPANALTLAAGYGLLALGTLAGLGPVGYLTGVVCWLAVLNLDLIRRLGRPSIAIRRHPRLVRILVGTVALLGSAEVAGAGSISVLFLELSLSPHAKQAAVLLPVLGVWGAGISLFSYLLRVYQPRVSLGGAGRNAGSGRRLALRLAPAVIVLAAGFLVGTVTLLALTGLAGRVHGLALAALLGMLLLARTPSYLALSLLSYRLENLDGRAMRLNTVGAVVALFVVAPAGLGLIPMWGAAGLLCGGAIGDLVQAVTIFALRRRLQPARAEAAAQPA
jgi:hypothetical protein